MKTQQFEKQVQAIVNLLGDAQKQIPTLRKETMVRALKGEIAVREVISDVLDDGLTVVGRGIVLGRKAAGSFLAKTHKKTAQLTKLVSQKADAKKPIKKNAYPKKARAHSIPVSRSH